MERTKWFERKFASIEDNGLLPGIIERLEGTPARISFKLQQVALTDIILKGPHDWSLKSELGHLSDLEPLWFTRLQEIKRGVPKLTATDLANRRTYEANHDQFSVKELLDNFSRHRKELVALFRSLSKDELQHVSVHPRLKKPMRAIDHAYFIAEHDDHHLAQMQMLLEEGGLL